MVVNKLASVGFSSINNRLSIESIGLLKLRFEASGATYFALEWTTLATLKEKRLPYS